MCFIWTKRKTLWPQVRIRYIKKLLYQEWPCSIGEIYFSCTVTCCAEEELDGRIVRSLLDFIRNVQRFLWETAGSCACEAEHDLHYRLQSLGILRLIWSSSTYLWDKIHRIASLNSAKLKTSSDWLPADCVYVSETLHLRQMTVA